MLDIKIVEIGYFLSRRGANEPPKELQVTSWKEAYQCFYEKVNPSNKTPQEFENSLKNVRDHFDSYVDNGRIGWYDDNGEPDKLPEQYQFVLGYLSKLSDEKLWEYIKPYAISNNELHWQFDISTFKLLGRELITDRITALVELVKNSYDANAKNVHIKFYNSSKNQGSKLIICDDGFGMSEYEVKNKWMRIGTDSKRINKFTPEPFNRRVVGEKGIGRFAIDKLGSHCKIYTKKENEKFLNLLTLDWSNYEHNHETNSFTKVNNKFKTRKFNKKISGVKIEIVNLHDLWTKYDLDRASKELAKIVSPLNQLFPPFNIYISSNEYTEYSKHILIKNEAFKYSSKTFELTYDLHRNIQQIIKFNGIDLITQEEPIKIFGPIKLKIYHFSKGAKGRFSKTYSGAELQIDGIKIYRDGILTTPFAENEAESSKRRDILGIDKRRYSGFFDRVGSRDIIGILEITKDLSPNIIDATNRQDFLDNIEYSKLKEFLIDQLGELEEYLKYQKKLEYEEIDIEMQKTAHDIEDFKKNIEILKNSIQEGATNSLIAKKIKSLENSAMKMNISFKRGIKQQKEERETSQKKETMYMSLMSLQTYALEITHIIKTSLSHIKERAEFNVDFFHAPEFQKDIEEYNKEILREIEKLDASIDFMSKYTQSGDNWEDFDVKKEIFEVFKSYQPIFSKYGIETIIEVQDNLVLDYNRVLFRDILNNLLNNSQKALKDKEKKLIKITSYINKDNLIIIFSDNGIGIPQKDRKRIFEIYHTTTPEEGGNGMGLYMVKTNIEAVKGQIDVIESELETGATFKLLLPFKR